MWRKLRETVNTYLNNNFDFAVCKLQLDFLAEVYLHCHSTLLLAKIAMSAYMEISLSV
jgi:hypothetical protein